MPEFLNRRLKIIIEKLKDEHEYEFQFTLENTRENVLDAQLVS